MSHFGKGVVKVWFYTGGDECLGRWMSEVVNVWFYTGGGERLGWWMSGWWTSYNPLLIAELAKSSSSWSQFCVGKLILIRWEESCGDARLKIPLGTWNQPWQKSSSQSESSIKDLKKVMSNTQYTRFNRCLLQVFLLVHHICILYIVS